MWSVCDFLENPGKNHLFLLGVWVFSVWAGLAKCCDHFLCKAFLVQVQFAPCTFVLQALNALFRTCTAAQAAAWTAQVSLCTQLCGAPCLPRSPGRVTVNRGGTMGQPSYLGLQVRSSKVTKNATGLSSVFPMQLALSSLSQSWQEGSRVTPKLC